MRKEKKDIYLEIQSQKKENISNYEKRKDDLILEIFEKIWSFLQEKEISKEEANKMVGG